tara:strand:+ start:1677 stop:1928 length:252 start_codon:yes stop_codon:yes gene_type:complete
MGSESRYPYGMSRDEYRALPLDERILARAQVRRARSALRPRFEVDELKALGAKLRGWLVEGPELVHLNEAERKIVEALEVVND